MVFNSRAGPLRFFETITTFAAPRDVTLDELHHRLQPSRPTNTRRTSAAQLASGALA